MNEALNNYLKEMMNSDGCPSKTAEPVKLFTFNEVQNKVHATSDFNSKVWHFKNLFINKKYASFFETLA